MDIESKLQGGMMIALIIVTAVGVELGLRDLDAKSRVEGVVVYKFHESERIEKNPLFESSTSVDDEDWGLVLNKNGEHSIVRVSESEWNQVCVGESVSNLTTKCR
jgi:hypothetical protein